MPAAAALAVAASACTVCWWYRARYFAAISSGVRATAAHLPNCTQSSAKSSVRGKPCANNADRSAFSSLGLHSLPSTGAAAMAAFFGFLGGATSKHFTSRSRRILRSFGSRRGSLEPSECRGGVNPASNTVAASSRPCTTARCRRARSCSGFHHDVGGIGPTLGTASTPLRTAMALRCTCQHRANPRCAAFFFAATSLNTPGGMAVCAALTASSSSSSSPLSPSER
mmetsp:Transcript_11919/g.28051  ORF Transcript_11919/g.28051 Transcript_11919/m.28051 type:complete len:226 (+) Transcript_11919:454-1131(+)